jgi:hypothetical protein
MKAMPTHAPAMLAINQAAVRIIGYKHILSYGVWMFAALSLVLLTMRAPLLPYGIFHVCTLIVLGVYFRWSFASERARMQISGSVRPLMPHHPKLKPESAFY